MGIRFLAGLLCGVVLGIGGSVCVYRVTTRPVQIPMTFPLPTVQSAPAGSPQAPPKARPRESSGDKYYASPLPVAT